VTRKIILLFLIVAFIWGVSLEFAYPGWWKKMFGQGYWMGRFSLEQDSFAVTLGDYETRIFILINTGLKKESYLFNVKTGEPVKIHSSVDYKISLTTWKDFVDDVNKIDERINEKLKEIRPEKIE